MAAPSSADATIANAPAGYNCLLAIKGYGSRVVRCTTVSYGMQIGTSEDESAHTRALYPLNQYIPAYDLTFIFTSRTERDALQDWLRSYMNRVSRNEKVSGYVFVQVPARRQAFNGVPIGQLIYGDSVPADLTYPISIRFVGVSHPISAVGGKTPSAKLISQYRNPTNDADAVYFYPAGKQKSGAESLEGTLYDPVYVPPKPKATTPATGGGGRAPQMILW